MHCASQEPRVRVQQRDTTRSALPRVCRYTGTSVLVSSIFVVRDPVFLTIITRSRLLVGVVGQRTEETELRTAISYEYLRSLVFLSGPCRPVVIYLYHPPSDGNRYHGAEL